MREGSKSIARWRFLPHMWIVIPELLNLSSHTGCSTALSVVTKHSSPKCSHSRHAGSAQIGYTVACIRKLGWRSNIPRTRPKVWSVRCFQHGKPLEKGNSTVFVKSRLSFRQAHTRVCFAEKKSLPTPIIRHDRHASGRTINVARTNDSLNHRCGIIADKANIASAR